MALNLPNLPTPQTGTRDLQLQTGDPASLLRQGQVQTQGIGQSASGISPNLGYAVMEMLKQYQQGTLQPQNQTNLAGAYQQQSLRSAYTPPSLIGASPSQQEAVRGAGEQAVQPTIQGYADILNASKKLVESIKTQQEQYKQQAHDIIANAVTAGSEALEALDPETIKLAGYSSEAINGLVKAKKRQESQKNLPTSYQEYELAKKEGFKGSYNDYQTMDANRKRPVSNVSNYFGTPQSGNGIDSYSQTTISGLKYIDGSQFSGKQKEAAVQQANQAGIPLVSKEQAEALQEIDNARYNQQTIIDQISGKLPRDAQGRLLGGAIKNKFSAYLQTDDFLAAMGSLRISAIQTLRAAAGSKGLRINQAEIAAAVENDIPKITDTVGVAQQKFKNIKAQLDNAEKSILVKNRASSSDGNNGATSKGLKYQIIK